VTGWSGRSAIVSLDVPTGRYAEVRCPAIGLDVPTGRYAEVRCPAIGLDRMASECGD
jgi:hypothetical protein